VTTVNFRLHSARKQLKKELAKMAQENLQSQRPSKDSEFADKIQEDLQAVQKLHNSLLPPLRKLFAKSLGREVEVEIVEAHQRMFGHYIQSLGTLCCNYCFKMDPLEGWINLDFSIPLCAALLKPEADGDEVRRQVAASLATPIGEKWMSDSDMGVIAELVKVIVEDIEKAWQRVRAMSIHDIELELVPSFIYMDRPTDPVIHIEIEVRSEGYEDLTLSLCYLLSTLEPALPDLK
jgi:flagellar motor switch protein FliM